jgi:Mn2+/Fe2+ NRAMP family transporter
MITAGAEALIASRTGRLNGLLASLLLVVLMVITSNPRIMGAQVNGRLTQSLGWLTALLMLAAAIGMLMIGS